MKNKYKNTITDLEERANKIINEMNDYINIPSDKITSEIHYKFEKKTKEKIDQLKILVDKATEEYNNVNKLIKIYKIIIKICLLINIYVYTFFKETFND